MSLSSPRILVAVDFSPSSERAVGEARRLAGTMNAQLDFVHICPMPPSWPELPNVTLDAEMVSDAHAALSAIEDDARSDGFLAKSHFRIGSPVAGLLDIIRQIKPAFVVLGSHGRGAVMRVMRLLLGSVAESVIRRSPVPVLVVPAPERTAAEPIGERPHSFPGGLR